MGSESLKKMTDESLCFLRWRVEKMHPLDLTLGYLLESFSNLYKIDRLTCWIVFEV